MKLTSQQGETDNKINEFKKLDDDTSFGKKNNAKKGNKGREVATWQGVIFKQG